MAQKSPDVLIGERLRMARKSMGYTQNEIAEIFQIGRPRYSNIENGKRHLSIEELYRFTDFYQRPLQYFLAQHNLSSDPFKVLFRAIRGKPETQKVVTHFEKLCNNLKSLENLMDGKDVSLVKDTSYRSIRRSYPWAAIYAEKERANLEVGKAPLKNLRDILEEKRDIQVFFLRLPDSISGMFAFGEDVGGCILINDSHSLGRQLYSLAHEYAHYLFDREKMGCVTEESKTNTPEERFANRFSADFLIPREAIKEMFGLRIEDREPTAGDVIYLADYFGVSFQAMIYRLADLRLIKRELGDRLLKETWINAVREEMGQPEPEQKQTKLPRRYTYLCILAYVLGKITTAKFADLLEIPLYKAMNIAKKIKKAKHGPI